MKLKSLLLLILALSILGGCGTKKEKAHANLPGHWTGTVNMEIIYSSESGSGVTQEIPAEIELDFYRDSTVLGIIKVNEEITFTINGKTSTATEAISFSGNLVINAALAIDGEVKPNSDGSIVFTYSGIVYEGLNSMEHKGEAILSRKKE